MGSRLSKVSPTPSNNCSPNSLVTMSYGMSRNRKQTVRQKSEMDKFDLGAIKEDDKKQLLITKSLTEISALLKSSGLSVEIVGLEMVAGLVASEVMKDEKNLAVDSEISADEAFEFFDVDGNDVIERGDIEVFLTLAGFDVNQISEMSAQLIKDSDENSDGKIDRKEWRRAWVTLKSLRDFRAQVQDKELRTEMVAKFGAEGPKHIPLYAFGATRSFYRLPLYPTLPDERPQADCVFFGCPFDGSVTYRSGARFGPAAVRQASQMTSFWYNPIFDKDYSAYKIYDAGDAAATPFDIQTAMSQVYLHAKRLFNTSKRVIGIGGDHCLSWAYLRAARDFVGGPVALVHLDSHLDTGDEYHGNKLSHGTALRRAMEDDCIDIDHSIHVGIHGSASSKDLLEEDESNGWQTMFLDEFVREGPESAAKIVKARVGNKPCVVSFDIDVIEPGECPGIGFPEPGGMRSRELFTFLQGLKGINCIGGEVCEFTPEYDANEVTAHCCAQGAYEIMCLALNNVEPTEEE